MKKSMFLLACLLWTGSLAAQKPDAESPVFIIDGAEIPTTGLKNRSKSNDSLIPWSLPDTIIGSKTSGEHAMFIYTYDERGNALRTEAFQKVSDVWVPTQRIDATFNRWDCVDTTIQYVYQQEQYVPNARKISAYDKQGRHITLTNYTYQQATDMFSAKSRYTYTYTDNNRLASSLEEIPDPHVAGGAIIWTKNAKTEYAYDAEGREISFEMSVWTGDQWMPYRAYYRTYENGRLVKELGRILNEITGSYKDTYRFEYHYNELDNLTDAFQFHTDSTGKWDTSLHSTYRYDERNLVVEAYTRTFDAALGELENSTREYYFYNDNGIKDSVVHEVWLSLEWVHTISLRYFYNEAGILNGRIYYNFSDDSRRTDKYEWEFNENGDGTLAQCFTLQKDQWVPADRYDLEVSKHDGEVILRANELRLCKINVHYADGFKTPGPLPDTTKPDDTTAIEPLKALLEANLNVYPNPATETLYVEINGEGHCDVTLSDLSGRTAEAFRMTAAGRKALDVSRYKGTYLLRVRKEGAVIAKKVIIL
ncbi:MAG: T9SS type A sorting domain-containing protein [Bacteroidales bacterium]|nr:T9SS type A sorting domain-containing protein [Bacteroidales bacterium]